MSCNEYDTNFKILYQCDNHEEAVAIMEEHAENNGATEEDRYIIIDLKYVIPHFLKYGKLRRLDNPVYQEHSPVYQTYNPLNFK